MRALTRTQLRSAIERLENSIKFELEPGGILHDVTAKRDELASLYMKQWARDHAIDNPDDAIELLGSLKKELLDECTQLTDVGAELSRAVARVAYDAISAARERQIQKVWKERTARAALAGVSR